MTENESQLEVAERLLRRAQMQLYCRGRGPDTLVECAVGDLISRYFDLKTEMESLGR